MQKPIELYAIPIRHHTREGDIVAEPFAGSGSQFIAAHRASRRCFGLEIEPRYCSVILARCEAEGLTVEKSS
jgi:DNA modification methylase